MQTALGSTLMSRFLASSVSYFATGLRSDLLTRDCTDRVALLSQNTQFALPSRHVVAATVAEGR